MTHEHNIDITPIFYKWLNMTKKTQTNRRSNWGIEPFTYNEMYNQAERGRRRDLENQRRNLEDRLQVSELQRNATETALYRQQTELYRQQIAKLRREEEEERREAYNKWLISPEGQAAIKKYNDRQYFIRVKSINFLFRRPYNLLARKNLDSISYKNYISVIFWIVLLGLFVSIGGIVGLIGGIITATLFIVIFYFVYFEIRHFFQM